MSAAEMISWCLIAAAFMMPLPAFHNNSLSYSSQCNGCEELRDRKFAHRDISASNAVVFGSSNGEIQAKLLDFGLAHPLPQKITTDSGQDFYQAPGALTNSPEFLLNSCDSNY